MADQGSTTLRFVSDRVSADALAPAPTLLLSDAEGADPWHLASTLSIRAVRTASRQTELPSSTPSIARIGNRLLR